MELLIWAAFASDDPDRTGRPRQLEGLTASVGTETFGERALWALLAWSRMTRGDPVADVLMAADAGFGSGVSFVDPAVGFEMPVMLGQLYMYCDRLDRAYEIFDLAVSEMTEHGWRGTQFAFSYAMRAHAALRRGRLADAEADARTSWRIVNNLAPDVPARWYALGQLVQVLTHRGQLAEAHQLAADHDLAGHDHSALVLPFPPIVCGELALESGQRTQAAAGLRAAGEWLEQRAMRNPAFAPWRASLAAALAPGDPAAASALAAEDVRRAQRFGAPWALGRALRCAGLAAEANGDRSAAESLFTESVEVLAGSAAQYEHVRSLLGLGALLRRGNQRTRAPEAGTRPRGPVRGPAANHPRAQRTDRRGRPAPARQDDRASGTDRQRTASRQASCQRTGQRADRPGPVRYPQNRGETPRRRLRQTGDYPPRPTGRSPRHVGS